LRDLGSFAARRRCRLPVSWLDDAGLNAEDVFAAQKMTQALRQAMAPFAVRVRAALANLNGTNFPRAAMPALAVATLARRPIGAHFDLLQPGQMPGWQRVARLSLANLIWRV